MHDQVTYMPTFLKLITETCTLLPIKYSVISKMAELIVDMLFMLFSIYDTVMG